VAAPDGPDAVHLAAGGGGSPLTKES
jgi:hypothetical protein